jgi:uncharacterized membrane protein YhiD involved in acid resistance
MFICLLVMLFGMFFHNLSNSHFKTHHNNNKQSTLQHKTTKQNKQIKEIEALLLQKKKIGLQRGTPR